MTKRTWRLARVAIIAATTVTSLTMQPHVSHAEHGSCGTATHAVPNNTFPSRSVSPTDPDDWYRHQAIIPSHTYTLQPHGGDADLEVYNSSCSRVCRSEAAGTTTDVCRGEIGVGDFYVRVFYYHSPGGAPVGYSLFVTNP